jgi:hypothetical protein
LPADTAQNYLRWIIFAAMKRRIRHRLLQRDQNVNLVAFIGAMFRHKFHHLVAALGNIRQHSGKRKFPRCGFGIRWLGCGSDRSRLPQP